MIVAPCFSMRSLGDVALKERRKLVRETPLHAIHLHLAEAGAIIAPPVPALSLDDIIDHAVGRVLDLLDLDTGKVKRWS
jgi:4-hydroxy-3-polyprenylbenzoate decarboxylase